VLIGGPTISAKALPGGRAARIIRLGLHACPILVIFTKDPGDSSSLSSPISRGKQLAIDMGRASQFQVVRMYANWKGPRHRQGPIHRRQYANFAVARGAQPRRPAASMQRW